MKLASCVVACLPILTFTLAAQPQPADWNNVQQLSSGTEIRVALSASHSVRGQVQTVTNDSLEMNSGSARQTFRGSRLCELP